MRSSKVKVFTLLLAGGLAGPAPARAGQMFDLGGYQSRAVDLTNRGQVLANVQDSENSWMAVNRFQIDKPATYYLDANGLTFKANYGSAMNENGESTGQTTGGFWDQFAWHVLGPAATDLGGLGGILAEARDIADDGSIVGFMDDSGDPPVSHAFLTKSGVRTLLGGLSGPWGESRATVINASGLVGGEAVTADGERHACLFTGGSVIDLFPLGGYDSRVAAMNSFGDVTGTSVIGPGITHGFVTSGGLTIDLGTLGGDVTIPRSINDDGVVVGSSTTKSGETHAFVYRGGRMHDLGFLGATVSGAFSEAVAVNSAGQIAGNSSTTSGEVHAFVYGGGTMTDLGTLGGTRSEATDLNDTGQVVGSSLLSDGRTHGFARDVDCGDGILDPGEQCDDGNTTGGDCCAADCTYPGPAPTCLAAAKASLVIQDDDSDGKDTLRWKWNGGGPVLQADLGDPSSTTTYRLCVSDSTGGVDRLVAQLVVRPSASWTSEDPEGWSYSDKAGSSSGVTRVALGAGEAGKARAEVRARGLALPMPEPLGAGEFFDLDSRVTVQLFSSDGSTCWTSEFTSAKRNTATSFSAAAR